MNANSQSIARTMESTAGELSAWPAAAAPDLTISVSITHRIEEIEAVWRQLLPAEMESPGQSYDFIRLWVQDRGIDPAAQFYAVGTVGGVPVALLPLHRKRVRGVRLYTWFPGPHANCYTPIADYDRLASLGPDGRKSLWNAMIAALPGADLVYLRSIPASAGSYHDLFDELGQQLEVETLFRAQFTSWEHCDSEQRSRSRRKHDRQQGDRLAALGDVGFEEVSGLEAARAAVATMFAQRSARFRSQGIPDIFVADDLIRFYQAALEPDSGLDVRLHVLRLNGEIVAVRYNIALGGRLFCLISSMSDSAHIQSGSPGKQCLLRVMQTVFDQGHSVFDMGAGLTDEKRHWCNVQIPLRQHYVGLSPLGTLVILGHRNLQRLRAWAKANPTVKSLLRRVHQWRSGGAGAKSEQL